jgi:dihydropteroate synthase
MYSLNCKGRLIAWEEPIVMGILNMTPDSFYSGSRIQTEDELLRQADKMITDGAIILDLGGLSSRPGAKEVSINEEMTRVVPAIQKLSDRFPSAIISVDSYRYTVAEAALNAGASMVNDIGAGKEENMMELAAKYCVPYICMHIRGNPDTMQSLSQYEDISIEVLDYFIEKQALSRKSGIKDLIIDPGFGFAKTISQNFRLLKEMKALQILNCPLLVGLSRKSTIYKTLHTDAEHSLNGTTVLHTLALQQGAQILRVHDVREAIEAIRLWTSYADA